MTNFQKQIIKKLLDGGFMCKSKHHSSGGIYYRLFDAKFNPIAKIPERSVEMVDRYLDVDVFKKDKLGRYVLNISNIRKLDGRNAIKKMYRKKLKERKLQNQSA